MTIYNPPHPGETLREDILPALGLSVTQAAAQLNVTRATLSRVLNGRAAISPEMALRLEVWLGVENGGGRVVGCPTSHLRPMESQASRNTQRATLQIWQYKKMYQPTGHGKLGTRPRSLTPAPRCDSLVWCCRAR